MTDFTLHQGPFLAFLSSGDHHHTLFTTCSHSRLHHFRRRTIFTRAAHNIVYFFVYGGFMARTDWILVEDWLSFADTPGITKLRSNNTLPSVRHAVSRSPTDKPQYWDGRWKYVTLARGRVELQYGTAGCLQAHPGENVAS